MKLQYLISLLLVGLLSACEKQLDVKADKSLAVPSSQKDLQALLDNTPNMSMSWPFGGLASADNYYVSDADYEAASLTERNLYSWGQDVYNDAEKNDWSLSYTAVFYANVCLDRLPAGGGEEQGWQDIRGQALFFRAYAFYQLAQLFAPAYDSANAATAPGIPLRLSPDLNIASVRPSLAADYKQILGDLKSAAALLPAERELKTRPSRAAAFALLARVYLSMRDYASALADADSCLRLDSALLDYNNLDPAGSQAFGLYNKEVILHSSIYPHSLTAAAKARVDSALYASYDENDLRKRYFYKANADGSHAFYGSYSGSSLLFNGLAVDELYLIKAECLARSGQWQEGLQWLNRLLEKRYASGSFNKIVAADQKAALAVILKERRKELAFRGLRWSDLRRLNKEADFAVSLVRQIKGQQYVLKPGSPHYVLPIPEKVISASGMAQNVY